MAGKIGHNRPPSKIDELKTVIKKAKDQADKVEVNDDDSAGLAGTLIKTIRLNKQQFEAAKKEEKAYYKAEMDKIEALYKPLLQELQDIINQVSMPLNNYLLAKQAEEQAKAERLAAEQQKEAEEVAEQTGQPVQKAKVPKTKRASVTSKYGHTASVRETWHWEIEDETEIPVELWAIDEKKINALVKSGERKIPGIRIYSEKSTVVR